MNPYKIALEAFFPVLMVLVVAGVAGYAIGPMLGLVVIALAILSVTVMYLVGCTINWLDKKSNEWEKEHS